MRDTTFKSMTNCTNFIVIAEAQCPKEKNSKVAVRKIKYLSKISAPSFPSSPPGTESSVQVVISLR